MYLQRSGAREIDRTTMIPAGPGGAAMFLPTVGKHGYSTMFFGFALCTVIYFITAAVFLPETKGTTLEEIEAHFEGATGK
jgi:hypothetical protein